jgi:hypothetical protein
VVDGDLGEKKPETRQVAAVKPKKHLRWECRDETVDGDDRLSGVAEKRESEGTAFAEYQKEKEL